MSQLGTDIRDFLRRLLKDRAGNTLVIVAASTLPLLALIGGGVDISRGYMAKTQLQAACDAGVLAGRRAMAKSGVYDTNERAKANAMFNFNYDKASVQANGDKTSFVTDDNDQGQVTGTATTEVPTAVMRIFGKEQMDLSVDCMAELQLANVDVMFVLDNTGSMICAPSETSCSNSTEKPTSKIVGLRAAVRDFHTTLTNAVKDEETRVRYGFVPYSTTTNAKLLITRWSMPTSYFTDSTLYSTRVATFDNKGSVVNTTSTKTTEFIDTSYNSSSSCSKATKSSTTTGAQPNDVITTTYSFKWKVPTGGTANKCVRTDTATTTTYKEVYYYTGWKAAKVKMDTSSYKTFASTSLATGFSTSKSYVSVKGDYKIDDLAKMSIPSMTTTSYTWSGCLEERDTVAETSFDPIPAGAHDLDLESLPTDDSTRWKPQWSNALYSSATTKVSAATCPAPMLLFQNVDVTGTHSGDPDWLTSSSLDTYLNSLVPTGYTYLDIGMIWGGRLGSPKGIFEDNVNADDEENVSRHLIFMTDGRMEPNPGIYNAYGVENLDHRIAVSGTSLSDLTAIHTLRFRAACDAAKAQGYTIYVISFGAGSTVTSDLKYCSSGGRAYKSDNTTDLSNTFKFIASQVADLRLGK